MLSSLYIIYQCMGGCGPWTVDWSILLVLYWKCFRNRWPIRAPGIDLSRDSRAGFIWNQARELRVPFLISSNGNLCSPHGYVSVYGSFWFAQPWLNCHGEKQKRQWGTRSTHIAWRTRSSFSAIVYLATGLKEDSRTDVSTARPITGRPTSLSQPPIFTSKNDFALLELDFHGHQDHPLGGQCLTCLLLQLDFHRHEWSFHSLANTHHPPHQWEAATNRMKGLHV